jgi:hypothetical protein
LITGKKIIGLDIGSKHNGVAIIDGDTNELLHIEVCTRDRLLACVKTQSPKHVALVGIEKFVLYPWAAESQSFKEFENVQLIGVVKYILDELGIPYVEMRAVDSKSLYSKNRLARMGYEIERDPYDHKRDALSVALYANYMRNRKTATKPKRARDNRKLPV